MHSDRDSGLPRLVVKRGSFLPITSVGRVLGVQGFRLRLLGFKLSKVGGCRVASGKGRLAPLTPIPCAGFMARKGRVISSFFVRRDLSLRPPTVDNARNGPLRFFA